MKFDVKKLVIVTLLLGIVVTGWLNCTKDERSAKARYEQLVEFANRQTVEIAIIEQAARLQQLKTAVKEAQLKSVPVNTEIPKEVSDEHEDPDSK